MSKVRKIAKHAIFAVAKPGETKKSIKLFRDRRQANRLRRQQYIDWYKRYEATELNPEALAAQREEAKTFKHQPLISILVPTYNTRPDHLAECIESVLAQTYTNWELCFADDASPKEATREVIKKYVKKYKNIKATFSKVNQHIALTTNIALELANGEFISLLDHDDLLTPNALFETVKVINQYPDVDLIYSDEDKIEDDKWHVEPFFKPAWSPDFLNSCNYITHFATIRHDVMKQVGGFAGGTEGAQDWDLFLRITRQTKKVQHISKILYNWRKSNTSTAQTANSKPYAYINQKKVLRKNIADRGLNAWVEAHQALGFWRVHYATDIPLVSIVIPTKDQFKVMSQCVDSILENTSYPYFEVVIVDTGSTEKSVQAYYDKVTRFNNVRVVNLHDKPFNFSKACNFGASKAKGDYLLFLNNDTEVISHDWIQGLLEHAQRPEVGMVGAKLLFPSQNIQHAGVVLSERDIAYHPFYNQDPKVDIFSYIYTANIRNTAAVTAACSMVSKEKFKQVRGFYEKLRITYNDVDLCLKLLDKGYKNVYTPYVELFHYESVSVGRVNTSERDHKELAEAQETMRKRWGKYLKNDPYYNANFEQHGPGYRLPLGE